MKKHIYLSILIMLFCTAAFAQKNVAVLEIDRHPDIVDEISRREAMEITNVIRGEAVRVLPRAKYSVMTSETVQSMGDAVLADCSEENCVITIGRRIDAEYIVRGTLSKYQTRFTLNIEMFETEYGNLIATAAPIRSENLNDILDKSGAACAEMYKTFLELEGHTITQTAAEPSTVRSTKPEAVPAPPRAPKPQRERAQRTSPLKLTMRISAGALAVGGVVGGVIFDGKVADEVERHNGSTDLGVREDAKEKAESHATARNILYTIGGVGLSGFALTLFF